MSDNEIPTDCPSQSGIEASKGDIEFKTRKARHVLRPSVQAALTLQAFDKSFGEVNLFALVETLGEQIADANKGDQSRAEAMLVAQAHSLDAIFNNLARKAVYATQLNNVSQYLKLALRAQSQCRSTLEALSQIKNPARNSCLHQTNIAHGPQQVNVAASSSNCGVNEKELEILQNELMEEKYGERLDFRKTR